MAFPFVSASNGIRADECVRITGRTASCQDGWRDRERIVAGLMVGVAVGVFVWRVGSLHFSFVFLHANDYEAVIVASPAIHPSWARDTLRLPPHRDSSAAGDTEQRVIEYGPYTDDPVDDETAQEARREIEGLNSQSQLALRVEASRVRPSALLGENQWARVSDDY